MNTKFIITSAFAIGTVATTLVVGANMVHAQTQTPFSGLAVAIAQKFGIDQTQVQNVITSYHQDQAQKMQQNIEQREQARLDQLVTDGKITASQEAAIKDEIVNLKSKYNFQSMKGLTPDQRKTQMDALKNDINSWAQAQGIDQKYLHFFGFPGMMRFGSRGWGKVSPTPTP